MNLRRCYQHGERLYEVELDVERRIVVVSLNAAVRHRTAVGAGGKPGSLPAWLPREVQGRLAQDLARMASAGAADGLAGWTE